MSERTQAQRRNTPAAPGRTPAAGREPGRRDAQTTREALIGAATAEFARNGFAGARVDAIAAAAGVNKQLVYYHYDHKDGLYQAVLESVYAALREKERALSLEALPPAQAMERLVGFSFDYLCEHPEFISLLTDENRLRGQHVAQSQPVRQMHMPLVQMIEGTLRRGVADGVFRPDYDAVNLYISIAGLSYFYFSNRHTLSAIFGKRLDARAAQAARRRHVIAFTLNALRAP